MAKPVGALAAIFGGIAVVAAVSPPNSTEITMQIADSDIGGARVKRTFFSNERQYKAGELLSAEAVVGIRMANRRALIDSNYLEVYPKAPVLHTERFMIRVEKDGYNVIEGRIINDAPLSRDAAEQLTRA